jgi:predicted site-specific integrase-resolvase
VAPDHATRRSVKHLYLVREAARLAHIPTRTIYLWIAEGRLTVVGPRRSQKVDLVEVEQLRDLRRQGGRLPKLAKRR